MENQKFDTTNFCTKCGLEMQELELFITKAPCWNCKNEINIAFIRGVECDIVREISNNISPAYFTENERNFANSKGANIHNEYSNTVNEFYYANSCPICKKIIGNHYLFTQYISPTINSNEYSSEKYSLGFCCDNCDNEKVLNDNNLL